MFNVKKIVMAAIVAFAFATPASADPITDMLNGIFQQPRSQNAVQHVQQTRRGRHVAAQPAQESGGFLDNVVSGGQRMIASFYGHGEKLSAYTASGQRFNPHAYTAAHRTYPFGTRLHVCHHGCVTVVVNDRGPFVRGRQLDLSYGAARAIGMTSTSSVQVARVN